MNSFFIKLIAILGGLIIGMSFSSCNNMSNDIDSAQEVRLIGLKEIAYDSSDERNYVKINNVIVTKKLFVENEEFGYEQDGAGRIIIIEIITSLSTKLFFAENVEGWFETSNSKSSSEFSQQNIYKAVLYRQDIFDKINIKDDSAAEKKIYIAYECPEILLSIAQEDKAVVEKSYFEFKIGGFRAKGNKQSSVLTFFRIYYEEMELRDVTTIKEI